LVLQPLSLFAYCWPLPTGRKFLFIWRLRSSQICFPMYFYLVSLHPLILAVRAKQLDPLCVLSILSLTYSFVYSFDLVVGFPGKFYFNLDLYHNFYLFIRLFDAFYPFKIYEKSKFIDLLSNCFKPILLWIFYLLSFSWDFSLILINLHEATLLKVSYCSVSDKDRLLT
jgi:hypothetical protein